MNHFLSTSEQQTLLQLARKTIANACKSCSSPSTPEDVPETFLRTLATFVTLKKSNELRGCVGSLTPRRTLIEDILQNAYASAFLDRRFAPVALPELPDIQIEISVLSPMETIEVTSESELLGKLQPGIDGLFIKNKHYQATSLPQVWEDLPTPQQFLSHLKQKAGIPEGIWPSDMSCFRYICYKFSESPKT